ncbi:flagellar biosynthesis anti-sigma factor FlgM [Candidatus Aerophobetes bacterium]|nr:flagellar biosynthesis anti-sigma factor FlgM [Candidatus Aerophobetes bacterium]HHJ00834.1 flagellar biosynthesis anti-sigma factor FlgM [Candidatus Aerophobetes bacterium]
MEIEGIGDVPKPVQKEIQQAIKRLRKLPEKERKDEVIISSEARRLAHYVEMVKNMSEVREDKVRDVAQKLKKGEYNSFEVMEKTIEKILRNNIL